MTVTLDIRLAAFVVCCYMAAVFTSSKIRWYRSLWSPGVSGRPVLAYVLLSFHIIIDALTLFGWLCITWFTQHSMQ